MSSTAGSTMQSADRVTRAAVVLHGRPEALGSGLERLEAGWAPQGGGLAMGGGGPGLGRLEAVAAQEGVELAMAGDGQVVAPADVQVAIVLGGDGTMLRALHAFLGTGIPVIGVNFGRVGFLSAIPRDELEHGVAR